jgi:hypothetical protein
MDRPGPTSSPRSGEERPRGNEPWIETRAGGLFFLNAVVVGPVALVLVPVVVGTLVRGLGLVEGPSAVLDTIPAVAEYVAPTVGWLAAPAAWLAVWTLRETSKKEARWALLLFLAAHLGVLAYTVSRWIGGA